VQQLTAQVRDGGPESAIEFCSSEAMALTQEVHADLGGLEVKRTSTRVRPAYLRGRGPLTFTYRPVEGAETRIESESVHLSIARRDAEGRWRVIRVAWISQP